MRRGLIGLALLFPLVAGCAEAGDSGPGGGEEPTSPAGGQDAPRVLAKVDGWRHGLVDSLGGDQPFALVEIAFDPAAAARAWEQNVPADLPAGGDAPADPGRYDELESVDFETQAVVVWSSGESGSCPGWLSEIRTEPAGGQAEAPTEEPAAGPTAEPAVEPTVEPGAIEVTVRLVTERREDRPCTEDFHPYRMVLAVERELLPDPRSLPTSAVVVDGRPLPEVSLVRVYP